MAGYSRREVLGKIAELYKSNPEQATAAFNSYQKFKNDPTTSFYRQYSQPTNRAITYLTQLGFDTNVLDDDWFNNTENQSWMRQNLVYDGATNTPKAPTKKSTNEERTAYWLNQYYTSEQQTKKAEDEMASARKEARYLAGRTDLNLSDDEIVKMVRGENFQSKFPTLYKLENSGNTPLELNRAVDWDDDVIYGEIWQARNPDSGSSFESALMKSYLNEGNVWKYNPEIATKLDRENEAYNPYLIGNVGLLDAGYHFDRVTFDREWLEQNASILTDGTKDDIKFYKQAQEGVENREKADAALAALNSFLEERQNRWITPQDAQTDLDMALQSGKVYAKDANGKPQQVDISILNKMDVSLGKDGGIRGNNLVTMAGIVDYKYEDYLARLNEMVEENNSKLTGLATVLEAFNVTLNKEEPKPEAQAPIEAAAPPAPNQDEMKAVQNEKDAEQKEEDLFGNAAAVQTPDITPAQPIEPAPIPEPAAVEPPETGLVEQETEEEQPIVTQAQIEQEKEDQIKIANALYAVSDVVTPGEKAVMMNAGGAMWGMVFDSFNMMKSDPEKVQAWLGNTSQKSEGMYYNSIIDNADEITKYYGIEDRIPEEEQLLVDLEAKYGKVEDYMLAAGYKPEDKPVFNIDFNGTQLFVFTTYSSESRMYELSGIVDEEGQTYGIYGEPLIDENGNDIMQEIQEDLRKMSADRKTALKAQAVYDGADETQKKEIDSMRSLKVQIQQDHEYIESHGESVNEMVTGLQGSYTYMGAIRTAMECAGMDTSEFDELEAMTEYACGFIDEPPIVCYSDSEAQEYVKSNAEFGVETTNEDLSAHLHKKLDNVNLNIDRLNMAMDYLKGKGYTEGEAAKVLKNMAFKMEDFLYEKKVYEYDLLRTDTDPEEFQKNVETGKWFEQRLIDEERLDYIDDRIIKAYKFEWLPEAREDEKEIYYYLLGKSFMELGGEWERLLSSPDGNESVYEAPAMLERIMQDSSDYLNHLNDDNHGVWTSRRAEEEDRAARETITNTDGFLPHAAANLGATLLTPVESAASALYLLDLAFTGERINPKSSFRRCTIAKEGTREETRKLLDDIYDPETDPVRNWVSKIGYEIYVTRGDSLMNQFVYGGVTGGASGILPEIVAAMPMGATAGLTAGANAVQRGASMDQAWLIIGANFFAETVSEGITGSNIKAAIRGVKSIAKGEFKNKVKAYIMDWLKRSGLEEMVGEVWNQDFETWADKQVMKDQSLYEDRIREYLAQDPDPDRERARERAEALAYADMLAEDLNVAIVSYLSPGTDAMFQSGAYALTTGRQTLGTYRTATRSLQKLGFNNVSTIDLMVQGWRGRNQDRAMYQETEIQNNNETETSEQEESTAAPEISEESKAARDQQALDTANKAAEEQTRQAKARKKKTKTQEQQDTAADIAAIEQAKNSDTSTKSAVLSSAILISGLKNNNARSGAAAVNLYTILGDNAGQVTQEVLAEAAKINDSKTGRTPRRMRFALQYAALGDGAATQVIQSEGFKQATPAQKVQMLSDAVTEDMNNQAVGKNMRKNVIEFRTAMEINNMAAEGFFENAAKAKQEAEQAAVETGRAEQMREQKQQELDEAAQNLEALDREFQQNPTEDNLKQRNDQVTRVENADESLQQYEQHEEKAKDAQKAAEENAKQIASDTMKQARQEAETRIAEQDRQQAEQEAIMQEQEQIRQEEEAKLQAEEDERTGKAQEDEDNAKIDAWADQTGMDEQTRQRLKDRQAQHRTGKINLNGRLSDAESFIAIGALSRKLGVRIELSDKLGIANGKYDSNTNTIYLNSKNAKTGEMRLGQALVEVALHEITHSMEGSKSYNQYRDTVIGILYGFGDKYDAERYQQAVQAKQEQYALKAGINLTEQEAEQEIVADFARTRLNQKEVVQRFMDAGMGGRMRNTLHNVNQAIQNYFARLKGEDRTTAEYLRKAERAFQKALVEKSKTDTHPTREAFSIPQFVQSLNLQFDEGTRAVYDYVYDENGERVKDENGNYLKGAQITEATPAMIENTPLGMLIENGIEGVNKKGIDNKVAAKQMFADLMTLILKYRDSDLVWEIAGSTLDSPFSALKSNSDTQYLDTIDMGTICAKTQAIVNVMSDFMARRAQENKTLPLSERKYGLTRQEVMQLYKLTHEAGLSVPCPVCYVFSRWIGVPSLLGKMSKYQDNYVVLNEDGITVNYEATQEKISEYLKELPDKETVDAKEKALTKELATLEKERVKLEDQLLETKKKLTPYMRKKIENRRDAVLERMTQIDSELDDVDAYNWVTQALCKENEDGTYTVDPEFEFTPEEIMYDLNRTGEFTKYVKNWTYRTTRGSQMGKAILPYGGMAIGDIVNGKTRLFGKMNPFLAMDKNAAIKAINDAQNRAARQNLVGGQRLQSTSDYRPEWGLDYLMAFMELQAMNSSAQMYTKVAEAVDFFASVGADVNLSIMGAGSGYHIATEQEIEQAKTDKELARRMGTLTDADGNQQTYVMDFSDITGMEYGIARSKSKQYNNVQMILVGMNDIHVRLAMANDDIDFIIPWHSSGNSKSTIQQLVASVREQLDDSSDFSFTQSDKKMTRKVRGEDGKLTEVDARTQEQIDAWEARIKILTGKAEKMTDAEMAIVFGSETTKRNEYLFNLYQRFYAKDENGNYIDPDCGGVKMLSAQAKQIFPYEYWDTTSTRENADINGERFIEYCQSIGITPRFSGKAKFKGSGKNRHVVGEQSNFAGAIFDEQGNITGYDTEKMAKGYWKLLIDRKMFENDVLDEEGNVVERGKYRKQQKINVTDADVGYLSEDTDEQGRRKVKYVDENGVEHDSMIANRTSAKYGANYSDAQQKAVERARAEIDGVFDLQADQTQADKLDLGGDLTDAEMDEMLRSAGVDYNDAVSRNDYDQAQQLVDFMAEMNGFDTDNVAYHGTNTFGFTMFDLKASQDAIFLSYTHDLAKTYQDDPNAVVREIGDESAWRESYEDLNSLDGKELEVWMTGMDMSDMGLENVRLDYLGSDRYMLTATNAETGERGSIKLYKHEIVAMFNQNPGIYQFYTKPGNQLFIDANGAKWNDIMVSDPMLQADIAKFLYGEDADADSARFKTRQIAAYAKAKGYDSVRINNVYDNGGKQQGQKGFGDIGIFFNQDDVKSADSITYDDQGNPIPLEERFGSNADFRYSIDDGTLTDAEMDEMLRGAGVLDNDQQKTKQTEIPLEGTGPSYSEGPAQRQFGSDEGMLQQSDEIADEAIQFVSENNAYFPDTNAEQVRRAINWIAQKKTQADPSGFVTALREVESESFDYRSADGQARMVAVMAMAAYYARNSEHPETYIDAQVRLANAFNKQGTDLGRMLQARKLFKMMTPEGRLSTFENMLTQLKDEYARKGKNVDLKFSDWLVRAIMAADTEEQMDEVKKAAGGELAAQLPVFWKDRLQAFRMLAMLANPRTHIRNVLGNMMFIPAVSLKNKIGAVLEIATRQEERTKTLAPILSKEIRQFARQDAKENKSVLRGEAKYNDQTDIQNQQSKLGAVGDFLSDWNSRALEGEDWIFLKGHYRRALGGWIKANGYTIEQLQQDEALLQKGREYAINEAQKATYRDFSLTAQILNENSRKGGVWGFMIDAALPFKKTPINILKRGVEYSPAGIAKGMWNLARHLKEYQDYQNGKTSVLADKAKSPNQIIDMIASGLSGTITAAIGYLLAGAGCIHTGLDDDDDAFEKLRGAQSYSVDFGKMGNYLASLVAGKEIKLFGQDVTYTMDWSAPTALSVFMGAAVREMTDEEGGWDIGTTIRALGELVEPIFNLSMLDGVQSLFKTSQYDDTNELIQIPTKLATNYLTSYIPSAVGATTRTFFDDTRRASFVTKGDNQGLEGTVRYAMENVENKLPGLSKTNIPIRDAFGNAESDPKGERAAENFISPGYIKKYKADDPVINGLEDLYKVTKKKSLIPVLPDKSITYKSNGESITANLGPEEYDTYTVVRGQNAYNMLDELFQNEDYQKADDDAKVEMISKVWSYADKLGQQAVFPENIDVVPESVSGIAKDGRIASTKRMMIKALDMGDYDGFVDLYTGLIYDYEMEASEIKTAITNHYRPLYQDAYRLYQKTGRREYLDRMNNIRDTLMDTDMGFDILKWEADVDKKYGGDSSRSLPKNGRYIASNGMSDVGTGAKLPERPSSDSDWDQYMNDLDDYWADYDFDRNDPVGQYGKGNIDLNNRKVKHLDNGQIMTEESFSFWDDDLQKEVLVPTVIDGKKVSDQEAEDHYYQTGEYLGIFDDWHDADDYAMMLHHRQGWYYNR